MKLEELLRLFFEEKIYSPQTILKYKSVIRVFKSDTDCVDTSFARDTLIKWRNDILGKQNTRSTCHSYFRHMRVLFNFAVKFGLLKENLFNTISLPKINKTKSKTIDIDTLNKLIHLLKTDPYYSQLDWFYLAIIDVLLLTAIRRRQLIGIKWRDIDFINNALYLDAEFSKNSNDNLVPINAVLVNHFLTIRSKSKRNEPHDQVFNVTQFVKTYRKNVMHEGHLTMLFAKWSKKIGINISAHRFRHTTATKIANSGVNLKAAQQLLGHKSIKTTMGYIEVNLDDLRKIQDLL